MNREILDKINEIIELIEKSDEYIKYQIIKDKISKNKVLLNLINEVRVLQKDVVHHLDKKDELQKKMSELNGHPLYREYENTLVNLNNTYSIVENRLNNYFQNKLN